MKAPVIIKACICTLLAAHGSYGQELATAAGTAAGIGFQPQQFRLRNLEFTGNTHTRGSLLRWMIPLVPGDIFDQSKWELGLDQINRLGLFEPVSRSDASFTFDYVLGFVDVELKLTERDRQRIDLSGGGGTSGGVNIGLDYSNINLRGVGDRLAAQLREGNRERTFGAGYSVTLLRKSPITLEATGFYRRINFVDARTADQNREPLFVEKTAGATFGLSFPIGVSRYRIGTPLRFSVLYSFASTNLADTIQTQPDSTVRRVVQEGIRVASVTPSFEHNSLDRQWDPLSGQQLTLTAELSTRFLGGSMNTIKPTVDYRRFFPLGPTEGGQPGRREPSVIGVRLRFSHIAGAGKPFQSEALSSVGGIPIFRRFFLGGENEVRGFDVNSIAPLARIDRLLTPDGEAPVLISSEVRPVGGDSRFIANAEYRIPIIWRLSAAAFADFGASFNLHRLKEERFETRTEIQPEGTPATLATVLNPLRREDRLPAYRWSVGGELRFMIPVFNVPLRFIVAANPNAQKRFPIGALVVTEKKFFFGIGFGRTL